MIMRVLLVEDDEGDYQIVRGLLEKMSPEPELTWISDVKEGLKALLTESYDVCLVDYCLDDEIGLKLVREVYDRHLPVPTVVMTGMSDHYMSDNSIKYGATDFLPKNELNARLLARTIRHAIARKKQEMDLRNSRDHYRRLSEIANTVIHNVGNVLNSVRISCGQLNQNLEKSRILKLKRVNALIEKNIHNRDYFYEDPKGQLLPAYLRELESSLDDERVDNLHEIRDVCKNLLLVKDMMEVQQTQAKSVASQKPFELLTAIEDALKVQIAPVLKGRVEVVNHVSAGVLVKAAKTNLTHVLIYLLKRGVGAMAENEEEPAILTFAMETPGETHYQLTISDTGEGMSESEIAALKDAGFIEPDHGPGIGLRFCHQALKDMGGSFDLTSEGRGKGMKYLLNLYRGD